MAAAPPSLSLWTSGDAELFLCLSLFQPQAQPLPPPLQDGSRAQAHT